MAGDGAHDDRERDAEDARWEVLEDEGIRIQHLRALVQALEDDFSVEAMGYAQLRALSDPYQRAVISDFIGRSAQATADNLLEGRLAQRALEDMHGPDGVSMPTEESGKEHIRRGAWTDIHLDTALGSLESAFDCLAAVATGVLRIRVPIKRVQLSRFNDLNTRPGPTPKMDRAWKDWHTLLTFHGAAPPPGWRDWLNGMRNLYTHRARQNRVLVQRTREDGQPQLVLLTADPQAMMKETARFDHYLRARPELTDMEDFVLTPQPEDLWLRESAQVTVAGVFDAANEFIEDAARFLLSWWRYTEKWNQLFPVPTGPAWDVERTLPVTFGGAAPATDAFKASTGVGYPTLGDRLAVAEKLRTSGSLPGAARSTT